MKTIIERKTKILSKIMFLLVAFFALVLTGCEGPAGQQGEQGPAGPTGPAGDDGSVMYSGTTAPDESLGSNGDYYLNLSTSELYGPKDETDIWGSPIDLSGEDGEDGNTILTGSGNPDASVGAIGDYYIDEDTYNLWGPKAGAAPLNNGGWGVLPAINLQATANATVHYFDGFDYTAGNTYNVVIDGVTQQELAESSWNVYLSSGVDGAGASYHVPGYGTNGDSEYRVFHQIGAGSNFQIDIKKVSGPGEVYLEVRIVQVLAGNINDNRSKSAANSFTIENLNFDNYNDVAQYFGLKE